MWNIPPILFLANFMMLSVTQTVYHQSLLSYIFNCILYNYQNFTFHSFELLTWTCLFSWEIFSASPFSQKCFAVVICSGFTGLLGWLGLYSDESMGWTTEGLWYNYWKEQEICLFFTAYKLFLGAHSAFYAMGAEGHLPQDSGLNVKLNIPLFDAEVKNEWCCTSTAPRMRSWHAQGKRYLLHWTTCCPKSIREGMILTTDVLLLLQQVINTWLHLGQ